MTTLILSGRHTKDAQALWRVAIARGWDVVRARGITVPPLPDPDAVIYVEALYGPPIAAAVGRALLEPPIDWLPALSPTLRHRRIELATVAAARASTAPAFVKPPNDKSFAAAVYASGAALPPDLDPAAPVLIAEPVRWRSEYRCFCLDGEVATASPYLRDGALARDVDYAAPADELAAAIAFATQALAQAPATTPRALALDVGLLADGRWAVVEANGAWGAGIYGCDPDRALDVIRAATVAP